MNNNYITPDFHNNYYATSFNQANSSQHAASVTTVPSEADYSDTTPPTTPSVLYHPSEALLNSANYDGLASTPNTIAPFTTTGQPSFTTVEYNEQYLLASPGSIVWPEGERALTPYNDVISTNESVYFSPMETDNLYNDAASYQNTTTIGFPITIELHNGRIQ